MQKISIINSKVVTVVNKKLIVFQNNKINLKDLKKNEVVCETLYSCISPGTETAAYLGLPHLRKGVVYPRVVGYCNVSRIIDVTKKNKINYKIGDIIYSFQSHRSHFKINVNEIVTKLPKNIDYISASCAYIFHFGYDAVIRMRIKKGTRIIILGLGPIGLGITKIASLHGAEIICISDQPKARMTALKYGAREAYSRQRLHSKSNLFDKQHIDVLITTSNSWKDWSLVLSLSQYNSKIGVVGFPGRGYKNITNNPLDTNFFYANQLTIRSLGMPPLKNYEDKNLKYNLKKNMKKIVKQIYKNQIDPTKLISGIIDFNEIETAYKNLLNKNKPTLTYVLKWKN